MKTNSLILSIILLFSGIIRLISLNNIPSGINDDELHFILNSKSFFYTFKNIEGNTSPFQLSEMSSLIFAPIIGPLPTNLFTARLPYALIGCLTIALIYLLVFKLTQDTTLAIFSTIVASVNPWSVYVSRTSFDAPVAIFFYLLTIYFLTFSKPKYILLSAITGYIAFNSYIATKILYTPIIMISSYYLWLFHNKKNGKQYLISILISLLISLHFLTTLPNQLIAHRIKEIQTPNSQIIRDQVNLERRQSLQHPVIRDLITNKYTIYIRNFIQKYLYNFSTDILFLNGDHTATGSLWKHGYFYYIDALLIIFGIIFLYTKHRKFFIFISFLILLSPIPEALRSDLSSSYIFHSSFQYPFLYIIISAGILFFWQLFTNKYVRSIFILVYILSFINFIDIYFYQAPIYQSESFVFSHRVLSKYLLLENSKNREIYVLTQKPEVLFRSYLFYAKILTKTNTPLIQNIYSQPKDNITFDNIHFINHNKYLPENTNHTLIYDTDNFSFDKDKPKMFISRLSDAGRIFSIHRGLTCQNTTLSAFSSKLTLKNLKIENLTELNFCEKYITI